MASAIPYCLFRVDDDTMAPVVMFKQDTYLVTEGVSSAVITLEKLQTHDFSFDVMVTTRDGSAVGEHHAIHSLWRNLFQYHCT